MTIEEVDFCGRKIFVAKSTKSLTVNVCDASNRRKYYEWKIRVQCPTDVSGHEITAHGSMLDLVEWLQRAKGGKVEKSPPREIDPGIVPAEPPGDDAEWILKAVAVVEQTLDQLIAEFMRAPYLHRVEHSLHARLFALLAVDPLFKIEMPFKGGVTQPIHKEWPETVASQGTKRGNFDLAILSPELVAQHTVKSFRRGNIPAPIVIELGLDYQANHLGEDAKKLIQSRVRHGYLVHFTRLRPKPEEIELVLTPGGNTQVAFASTAGSGQFKRVGGKKIVTR